MNKTEFIKLLSNDLEETQAKSSKILDIVLQNIINAMQHHDELQFIGFGTFKAKQYSEKMVKTPKGTMVNVPPQRRVSFSVGSNFKHKLNPSQG